MKPRRLALTAAATGLLALAALPGAASANTVVGPSPLTFPEREVGSTSDPQTVTVTVICNNFRPDLNPGAPCLSQDSFSRNPQFFGDNPGDFSSEGGTCPATLTLITTPAGQCTILLRFKPTAAGQRKATFLAGTSGGGPGGGGGPNAIAVQGSAVAKPVQPGQPGQAGKKKCKKKKGKKAGTAAKKCKKKKK